MVFSQHCFPFITTLFSSITESFQCSFHVSNLIQTFQTDWFEPWTQSSLVIHNSCSIVRSIHGTGLMTEGYTPRIIASRTAQNIIKNMIVFWFSVTPLAICDTFSPIYPLHKQFFLQDVQISLPFLYYPTLCGWYERNLCWQPVHFTLAHRLPAAIFNPACVIPDISKLMARRLNSIARQKSILWSKTRPLLHSWIHLYLPHSNIASLTSSPPSLHIFLTAMLGLDSWLKDIHQVQF